jgi:cysteine desulfurase family protein (TIGR01976 family)
MTIDRDELRSQFPALGSDTVFLDNAGGSQVPAAVADRVRDYMLGTYVQLGADYELSRRASRTVDRARELARTLVGCGEPGVVAFGPSTSALLAMLADCYARAPHPTRDEIVVAESGHEANVGPWVRLEQRGYRVRWWRLDRGSWRLPTDALEELLCERTRLVALPHVSNILGRIDDLSAICRTAHGAGARVIADGVAFAPHRTMEVNAWDVDVYAFSTYKVYGPHMAALYATREALAELEGPNHFFVEPDDVPYKLELGGVLHEGCAGLLGLCDYLPLVAGAEPGGPLDRAVVERAFSRMDQLERPLTERLLEYLRGKRAVRIVGPESADANRVPTISFVHRDRSSREIALAANERGLGVRYGHFYAHRLLGALVPDPNDGVVRASMVHYNTASEVDRLIEFLDTIL